MLVKEPMFKGLDLRSNPLEADPARASDCSNVYLDQSNNLRNRPFFSTHNFNNGDILGPIKGLQEATFTSYDPTTNGIKKRYMLGYVQGLDLITEERAKIIRIFNTNTTSNLEKSSTMVVDESDGSSSNFIEHLFQYPADLVGWNYGPFYDKSPVKGVPYLDVMYFLAKGGLWKYDGLYAVKANLPKPEGFAITGSGSGTTKYYRMFMASFDFSGQWVFGDWEMNDSSFTSPTYNATGAWATLSNKKFDNTYITTNGAITDTATEVTIPSTAHNVFVGAWITLFRDPYIYKMRVKSFSGTQVVLDATEVYEYSVDRGGAFVKASSAPDLSAVVSGAVFSNTVGVIYVSTSETIGFQLSSIFQIGSGNTVAVSATYPSTIVANSIYPFTHRFEDCYDESKVKGLLDSRIDVSSEDQISYKFLASYGNILLAANDKQINFSDTSEGSTVENFDPFDFFVVGTSDDGPITGLFANDDFIVVHREKRSYFVTGNVVTGNFRSTQIIANKVGAISHVSQGNVLSQNFFISRKGAHIISGGNGLSDVGTLIEPVMRNTAPVSFGAFPTLVTEMPLVNIAIDDYKDHAYVIYESNEAEDYSGALVFNYRLREWYRWKIPLCFKKDNDGIITGGADCMDGLMYLSSGFNLFVENTATGGVTVDPAFDEAFYQSISRHLGVPSLEKRYTYLKLFALEAEEPFDLDVKTRYDWEKISFIDQGTMTFPNGDVTPNQYFDLKDLEDRRCFAIQFRISSENYLKLNSYELMEELVNEEVKV